MVIIKIATPQLLYKRHHRFSHKCTHIPINKQPAKTNRAAGCSQPFNTVTLSFLYIESIESYHKLATVFKLGQHTKCPN